MKASFLGPALFAPFMFLLCACDHAPVAHIVTGVVTSDAPGSSGGTAVRIDKDGNIILAGVYENDFTLAGTTLHSFGRHDIFLAKLDPQYHVLWLESFGGPGNDFPPDVAVDSSGAITLCCDFENMLNLTSRFALYADGHGQALIRVGADGAGQEVMEVQAKGGAHEVQINGTAMDQANTLRAVGNFSADTLFVRSFAMDGSAKGGMFKLADGSATLFVLASAANTPPTLTTFHEDGSVYALTNHIACSAAGHTFLCGTHHGALRFADKDVSGYGVYFATLTSTGVPVDARAMQFTSSDPSALSIDGLCGDDVGDAWALMAFKDNLHAHDIDERWNSGQGKDALLMRIGPNGMLKSAQRFGNGDDLFTKGVVFDASRQLIMVAGYHHGVLALSDKLKLPGDGKFNAFFLGIDKHSKVRTVDNSFGAGQQFVLTMDAREGSVAFAGTYFKESTIGGFALPQPGGRFFVGSMSGMAK